MKNAIIFDFNRTLYDPDTGQLMKDALEILSTLKELGFKMFLIGKGAEERTTLIRDLGLEPFFDDIIVNDEKDINDFFKLKKWHPGYEFYSVGDRIRKEIKYSNRAGCKTIWLKKGKFAFEEPIEADEEPWRTITELNELIPVLELKE
jgi:FMN phosphatase YigB (HAD superfamily)